MQHDSIGGNLKEKKVLQRKGTGFFSNKNTEDDKKVIKSNKSSSVDTNKQSLEPQASVAKSSEARRKNEANSQREQSRVRS